MKHESNNVNIFKRLLAFQEAQFVGTSLAACGKPFGNGGIGNDRVGKW